MLIDTIVMMYGILALSHLFIQLSFAHFSRFEMTKYELKEYPSVAIVIPFYQEEPELLEKCIKSALDLNYSGEFHVFAVDDGSRNKEAFEHVSNIVHDKLTLLSLEKNVGKRKAQKYVFDLVGTKYDIVVTLDSDTVLEKNSVTNLAGHFTNKDIGAVTGYASVINRDRNLLTKLINSRYWVAFNLERSAQSLFGAVLCCTGVITAYRNDIIQEVKEKYANQMFMGKECTYGDDRHLTNLVLEKGYKTIYDKNAVGWTDVPKTLKKYLTQQLRWNRSFYREIFITARMVANKPRQYPIYMLYDLTMQTVMPLMLIGSILYTLYRVFSTSEIYLLAYLCTLVGIALLRSIYAIVVTKDYNFLYFPLYAFMHLFLLIPLRIYALFTMNSKGWGTR